MSSFESKQHPSPCPLAPPPVAPPSPPRPRPSSPPATTSPPAPTPDSSCSPTPSHLPRHPADIRRRRLVRRAAFAAPVRLRRGRWAAPRAVACRARRATGGPARRSCPSPRRAAAGQQLARHCGWATARHVSPRLRRVALLSEPRTCGTAPNVVPACPGGGASAHRAQGGRLRETYSAASMRRRPSWSWT